MAWVNKERLKLVDKCGFPDDNAPERDMVSGAVACLRPERQLANNP